MPSVCAAIVLAVVSQVSYLEFHLGTFCNFLPSFPGFIEPLCFLVVRLFKGDRKTGYGYEASKASKLEDFRFLPYTTYEFQNLE